MGYFNKKTYKLAPIFKTKCQDNKYHYVGNYYALNKMMTKNEIIHLLKVRNYSDENLAIMAGDEDYINKTNPKLLIKNNYLDSLADGRTYMQYYRDLIAGWLLEDLFIIKIQQLNPNIKIILCGSDAQRNILSEPSNTVDFMIIYNNKFLLVELGMSHTGNCYYKGNFTLRNKKRLHLISQSAYLLEMETHPTVKKFTFLSPEFLKNYEKTEQHLKECNRIYADKNLYYENEKLAEVLIYHIENFGREYVENF